MYRLNRFNTAGHIFARFIATTSASTYLKRLNQPLRYVFYVPTSFNRHAVPPNPMNNNYKRKILPPELLSKHVVKLTCESAADGGVCDVYLIGTIHDSKKSCQQVEAVINFLKPQVVFLELCLSRATLLTPKEYEIDISNEFLVAYEEAIKYGGKVVLGDVPDEITHMRTLAKMPFWHLMKSIDSFYSQPDTPELVLTPEMLDELHDNVDSETEIQQINKENPLYCVETILHERDQYMSGLLLRIGREYNSVVAVVGTGHLRGIKRNWKQPVDLEQLLITPTKKTILLAYWLKTLGVSIAILGVTTVVYVAICALWIYVKT